jgi:transposase
MSSIARAPEPVIEIVGGVDTHRDTHTAAVIDTFGRRLGDRQFPATGVGYAALLAWLRGFGLLLLVGIESTGSYGSGLAGYLAGQQVEMVEVDQPDRRARRLRGKSDPVDADAAARAALARTRTGIPKDHSGTVEAIRNLRVARRSAVSQRADCIRQIKMLLVTAPDPLRDRLRHLPTTALMASCARLRPDLDRIDQPEQAAKRSLSSLARRWHDLSDEIASLDTLLEPLVKKANPTLLTLPGVGTDVAAQMLITAGQNNQRLRSEAAFAMMCGVSPIPASSGMTTRHRLNRGGDRQANAAIYRVALSRLRWDPATHAYLERRTQAGHTKRDIIRCLKRRIAREIYYVLRKHTMTT